MTPPDPELDKVYDHILSLDPTGERIGKVIRRTFDMLYDGKNTGRYRWEQLHKTEKTHCGTLIEINLQREFKFPDGNILDYRICGIEVDCKFSQKLADWMIPPEAEGHILLGLWANDKLGRWSAGLVRADPSYLQRSHGNRDKKRQLSSTGRGMVRWLFRNAKLKDNVLLRLPEKDVKAIFSHSSGQQRVNELFRRAQRHLISRTVVATVAQQEDYMARVRGSKNGARTHLRPEGIVIFGQYKNHAQDAEKLGLPVPGPGEFVSVRLARKRSHHGNAPSIVLDGVEWVVAEESDPVEPAPLLRNIGRLEE